MQKENGTFIISLDFELHWGIFDVAEIANKTTYFDNTLASIPKVLSLFEDYDVQCTWATVGMLFNNSMEELKASYPERKPNYINKNLSAYHFIENKYEDRFSKYYFAPKLIEQIATSKGQEIATHTYAHYYTKEIGQSKKEFENDMSLALKKANSSGYTIKSIVFPRNQYREDYNEVCKENGVVALRTNPNSWFWSPKDEAKNVLIRKVFRTLDCYITLARTSYKLNVKALKKDGLLLLPASRFYRPSGKNFFLRRLKQKRVKNEMKRAALKGECYHLWWHPHNFGSYPERCFQDLKEILNYYKFLNSRYGFQSMNMSNLNDTLID